MCVCKVEVHPSLFAWFVRRATLRISLLRATLLIDMFLLGGEGSRSSKRIPARHVCFSTSSIVVLTVRNRASLWRSIEYWPEPQRGICEAYRVIKKGGTACMIGPVHPTWPLSRWHAAHATSSPLLHILPSSLRNGKIFCCFNAQDGQIIKFPFCQESERGEVSPLLNPLPSSCGPQILRGRVDAVSKGGGVHRVVYKGWL